MFIMLQYHWYENDGDMRFTIYQHVKGVTDAFSAADIDLIRDVARKLMPQTCGSVQVNAQAGPVEVWVDL